MQRKLFSLDEIIDIHWRIHGDSRAIQLSFGKIISNLNKIIIIIIIKKKNNFNNKI